MRKFRCVAWLVHLTLWLAPLPAAAQDAPQDPPQVLFKQLFVAVQSAQVFADSKAFPDAIPASPPADILRQFDARRPAGQAALKDFVAAHFNMVAIMPAAPAAGESTPIIDPAPIVDHIDGLWESLTRPAAAAQRYSSLVALPRPYVVPGGRFREIYYWDSYFTMLGLAESGRHDLVTDMVADFAYMIDTFGHIPNGARTYYISRSQPPFFFAMVGLLQPDEPGAAFAQFLPQLRREYSFWMAGARELKPGIAHRRVVAMPDGSVLNRFWDDRDTPRDESYREDTQLARNSRRPAAKLFRDIRTAAESGWDFSSRWFADGRTRATIDTSEIVPVDLNSLLYGLENAIRGGCEYNGDKACVLEFRRKALSRRRAIDRYLWDARRGAYLDYRWTHRRRMERVSAATLYPLFVSLASQGQAAAVANITARELLRPGGIVTSTVDTGEQWDFPNGWAPLQWIAIAGLRNSGQADLAAGIACRWVANVNGVYRRSGKLVEKYDVVATDRSGGGGEYPLQDGFGWTNGVTRKLIALYPADAALTTSALCP
ncbi:MAG: alpha,alpha-trehalase TreF [Pseudomonadota bacterium]|nr:alpha,alpha-trehalase TreF [Pseudomonadota bacterium]